MVHPSLSSASSLTRNLASTARVSAQELTLAVLPSGGQGGSRRNAWRAMAADAGAARGRRAAQEAMRRAAASGHPVGSTRRVLGD